MLSSAFGLSAVGAMYSAKRCRVTARRRDPNLTVARRDKPKTNRYRTEIRQEQPRRSIAFSCFGGFRDAARMGRLPFFAVPRAFPRAGILLARTLLRDGSRLALARLRGHPRNLRVHVIDRARLGRGAAAVEPGGRGGARHLGRRRRRGAGLRVPALLVSPPRAQVGLALAPRAPDAPQRGERGRLRRVLPASAGCRAFHHLGGDRVLPA